MKRLSLFCLIFLAAVLFQGCKGEEKPGVKGHGVRAAAVFNVRAWRASRQDLPKTIRAVGTLEPEQDVIVSSEVTARLTRLLHDEGDRVRKGESLALLDNEKFSLRVSKTEADLKRARAALHYAEKDLERKRELLDEGMVTQEAYDQALSRRDSAMADVESMEAALRLAQRDLMESNVKAPFSGHLAERFVSVGSYVGEGERLFRLIDIGHLKVSASIPERHLPEVRIGQKVLVTTSTGDDGEFSGAIYFISPHVDEKTRSFEIKARIGNPGEVLKPGLFVDVTVVTGMRKGVFLVPESGVLSRDGRNVVFVVSDNTAHMREVTVLDRADGMVVVGEGLGEGELVVVDGAYDLQEGSKVRVVDSRGEAGGH